MKRRDFLKHKPRPRFEIVEPEYDLSKYYITDRVQDEWGIIWMVLWCRGDDNSRDFLLAEVGENNSPTQIATLDQMQKNFKLIYRA